MSETTASPEKKVINGLAVLEGIEFVSGISKKSGNEYLIGSVYIKSPLSEKPIKLGFEYIDDNVRELIKLSLDKFITSESQEFAKGLKD